MKMNSYSKIKHDIKGLVRCILVVCVFAGILMQSAMAGAATSKSLDVPYLSYIYQMDGDPVEIPAPYTPSKAYAGQDFGITPFLNLSDVFYDTIDQRYYFCDSGNNRIVVISKDFKLVGVLDSFMADSVKQTFTKPGSAVVKNKVLYIADTGANRIVAISLENITSPETGSTLFPSPVSKAVFKKPEISLLPSDYKYEPSKIEVDYANRLYVIASGVNQGLIQLDENGVFIGFLGAPKVVPKASAVLLRKIYTDAQKERAFKVVPTEYNSVQMDSKGFLYVSSQTVNIPPISKLNSQGENILKKRNVVISGGNKYADGDGNYRDLSGKAIKNYFVDVQVKTNGMYIGLDSNNGKLFAYDQEGLLLYAFGGLGSQVGTFYSPSALEIVDENIIITDHSKGTITVFKMTQFGKTVESAIESHRAGKYDESKKEWESILSMASNYETATIGLARIDILNSSYESAMIKLKPLGERFYYAMAYQEYRSQYIKDRFTVIFILFLLLVAILLFVPKRIKKTSFYKKLSAKQLFKEYRYANHVIFHPFDGFWDLKRERRGSVKAAVVLYVLFFLLYGIRAQFSGYIVTGIRSDDVNVLYELALIAIPIILFGISNWCFTTLMNGEGNMKDIFIAIGYALKPYILLSIPLLLLSHFLTGEEVVFYTVINTISVGWTIALLILGMMVTHDYSFAKNTIAVVLTLIGICLMIFIGLLFVNIVQDVVQFFRDIYNEISFRSY